MSSLHQIQIKSILEAMNMGTFQMAQRLAQLGEEIERVENQLRERKRSLLAFWGSLPKNDSRIRDAELRLQMLRAEQHSLILTVALFRAAPIN